MGGFLASTGIMLVAGAIGLVVGETISIGEFASLLEFDHLIKWLPWMIVAAAIAMLAHRVKSDLLLPICVASVIPGFYLVPYV